MKQARLPWTLGWVSLAIGAKQLAFPRRICDVLGASERYSGLVRALGVRELVTGCGLLLQPQRWPWSWARVAGDLMDLSLLAVTFWNPRARRPWQAAITASVVGITLVDLYAAVKHTPFPGRVRELKPSPFETAASGAPAESWRGSALAEEVGASPRKDEVEEPDEATRQRMMEEAAHALGLDRKKPASRVGQHES